MTLLLDECANDAVNILTQQQRSLLHIFNHQAMFLASYNGRGGGRCPLTTTKKGM
jgi:hypothetical protein